MSRCAYGVGDQPASDEAVGLRRRVNAVEAIFLWQHALAANRIKRIKKTFTRKSVKLTVAALEHAVATFISWLIGRRADPPFASDTAHHVLENINSVAALCWIIISPNPEDRRATMPFRYFIEPRANLFGI